MNYSFESKVALIVGASTGIGKSTALAFARSGAKIAIASRREKECEELVAELTKLGAEAIFIKTDVSISSEIQQLVKKCVEYFGRLDFAFNNAGIEGSLFKNTIDYEETMWDQVINVNLKGVWLCMKYEIPEMLKGGGGAIVNMASVAGLKGGLLGVAYYASKHGVVGLTKASAKEFGAKNIRINAVCPAIIATEMSERVFSKVPELKEKMLSHYPMDRYGESEEVANAVLWLCSEHASYITGHALPIDGGLLS